MLSAALYERLSDVFDPTLLIVAGIWCLYRWPRSIHRQRDRGEISEAELRRKLKKSAIYGYMCILAAICLLVSTLDQRGLFGHSLAGSLIFFSLSLGTFLFWITHKRKFGE